RGLCSLKVCARTSVARQPNDLRDGEPTFFLRYIDRLADARQGADAVDQNVARRRRYAQQVLLGLNRPCGLLRRLLLTPDVHLDVLAAPFLLELFAEAREVDLLSLDQGPEGLDQLVALVAHRRRGFLRRRGLDDSLRDGV